MALHRTRKNLVKLSAMTSAGLTALALAVAVVLPESDAPSDPTRRGPARYLELTHAGIEDRPAGPILAVRGETNLIDGTVLEVAVLSGRHELLALEAHCDGEGFSVEAPATGAVIEGAYDVTVSFRLERQTGEVRRGLDFQPGRLSKRRALTLPLRLAEATSARAEVRALFDAVNRDPRDPAVLDDLDRRARELADHVWLGAQKPALTRLRQALEEARRPAPRRREFDRLLLEAHVLAGL